MFTRDGQGVVFYSNRGGSWGCWTMRTDGSGLRQVAALDGGCVYPLASPVDDTVVFSGSSGAGLYLTDLSGRPPVELPGSRGPAGDFSASSFSPDGKRVAGYMTTKAGRSAAVAVYDLSLRDADRADHRRRVGRALAGQPPRHLLHENRLAARRRRHRHAPAYRRAGHLARALDGRCLCGVTGRTDDLLRRRPLGVGHLDCGAEVVPRSRGPRSEVPRSGVPRSEVPGPTSQVRRPRSDARGPTPDARRPTPDVRSPTSTSHLRPPTSDPCSFRL